MVRVLVTGATGFVGRHVLDALRGTEVELVAACRSPDRLPHWFAGEVRAGDLRDDTYVDTLPRGVDVVCHAAAWSSLHGHRREAEARYLQPTLRLLAAVAREGVGRLVFPSTHGAAPVGQGRDAKAPGFAPAYWPHLGMVVAIEEAMRAMASPALSMVTLRLGLFVGTHYSLGVLPILTERLKTRLVPYVDRGRAPMPLIAGEDVGQAFGRAVLADGLAGYEAFNVLGSTVPTMGDVLRHLHARHGLPLPVFSVPHGLAFPFARLMRTLDPVVPWDPLIVPAIVHLLQDFDVTNEAAARRLGYRPEVGWQDAIDRQMAEMAVRQLTPMAMVKALD